jgi:hypothetical protein
MPAVSLLRKTFLISAGGVLPLLTTSCSPDATAPNTVQKETNVVILYDRQGNERHRSSGNPNASFAAMAQDASVSNSYRAQLKAARDLVNGMQTLTPEQERRKALSFQLLDVLASRSKASFVARASALPVERISTRSPANALGMVILQTDFMVRSRRVLRTIREIPEQQASAEAVAKLSRSNASVLLDELPCYEDCGGGGWEEDTTTYITIAEAEAIAAVVAVSSSQADDAAAEHDAELILYNRWLAGPPPGWTGPPPEWLPDYQSSVAGSGAAWAASSAAWASPGPCDLAPVAVVGTAATYVSRALSFIELMGSIYGGAAVAGSAVVASELAVVGAATGLVVAGGAAVYCYNQTDTRQVSGFRFGGGGGFKGRGGGTSW